MKAFQRERKKNTCKAEVFSLKYQQGAEEIPLSLSEYYYTSTRPFLAFLEYMQTNYKVDTFVYCLFYAHCYATIVSYRYPSTFPSLLFLLFSSVNFTTFQRHLAVTVSVGHGASERLLYASGNVIVRVGL